MEKGANIGAKQKRWRDGAKLCKQEMGLDELVDLLAQFTRRQKQLEQMQSNDPREQFAAYVRALQQSPSDELLKRKIFQLANAFSEPPAIPEAARQLFVLAITQIKQSSTPGALDQPIVLLRKAIDLAPWWGNAYYNLSRTLEMRGQYDDASQQLKYYLELKPSDADADEARAHLIVIQTEKEAAAHMQ